MSKWQHLTIIINYEKKKHKDYVLEFTGKAPLVGLATILEAYGSDGWELVSLNPDHLEAYPGFGKWQIDPAAYRATFKRPVEG